MLIQPIQGVSQTGTHAVRDPAMGTAPTARGAIQPTQGADSLLLSQAALSAQKEYPESFAHEASESLAETSREADQGDGQAQRLLAKRQGPTRESAVTAYA